MRTEKLTYNLPPELIAQEPLSVRSDSRLLVLHRAGGSPREIGQRPSISPGEILDSRFGCIGDFLSPGDCLVLNDTKVMPARFFARRASGAKLEGLFLSPAPALAPVPLGDAGATRNGGQNADGVWTVYLKGTRKLKPHETIFLKDKHKADFCQAVLLEKGEEGNCQLEIKSDKNAYDVLETIGFPPLPPYIRRDDDPAQAVSDASRYQTVYAKQAGAVAAPTAGLHFTESLIEQLKQNGVQFAFVTLHVGAGTFKPITAENVEDHQIHREWFSLDEKNAEIINTARNDGGRIIPVGTTSTRVLETLASKSEIQNSKFEIPVSGGSGSTELFITPGYQFKMCDAMITNFHLPKSSLLALVAAFAGLDKILAAYHHAIEQRYRFYSYGDAMLIT